MPDVSTAKYLIRLRFEVDGVVEKPDIIGAIFGQTEGLFGPELNLHELQKTWKVGRIEIHVDARGDKTFGEVFVPMSTDVATAALVAAAVETVEKVGPFSAKFGLVAIEDVRAAKRRQIADRAKTILKDWASRATSEGEELLKEVSDSAKRSRLVTYGREELPAGPAVFTSDTVILVEGRADVINLLRAGVENVVAIEGTKIPDSIARLSKDRKTIAFLDGDRAGDLILRELQQVAKIDAVIRAPPGKEVEELTPVEILELLRDYAAPVSAPPSPPIPPPAEAKPPSAQTALWEKVRELHSSVEGTLEAVGLDDSFSQVLRVPVSELVQKLDAVKGVKHVVFDGIVTQRLLEAASRTGVASLVGQRIGELEGRPPDIYVATFRDLGFR